MPLRKRGTGIDDVDCGVADRHEVKGHLYRLAYSINLLDLSARSR